jgi:hypothetical protein
MLLYSIATFCKYTTARLATLVDMHRNGWTLIIFWPVGGITLFVISPISPMLQINNKWLLDGSAVLPSSQSSKLV